MLANLQQAPFWLPSEPSAWTAPAIPGARLKGVCSVDALGVVKDKKLPTYGQIDIFDL